MCKYSDETGYECQHENLKDNDYCIFHLQDDNKDVDEFNKGIKKILETEEDLINFHGFYFPPDSSYFSDQNFLKNINFRNVIFSGISDFSFTTFSGEANFIGATFSRDAKFYYVLFSGIADFSFTTFSRDAKFCSVIFSRDAYFETAKFSGEAEFRGAKFSGEADFERAKFSGEAEFRGAKFSGEADFKEAKFSGEADFEIAKFPGEANFMYAKFDGKFVFIPTESETIIFKNTYFSDNVRIKADLSKCSFMNSNIERVDMTDSIWIRDDDKPKKSLSAFYERIRNKVGLSKTSIIIWEDCRGELSCNWKELEGIYRRLKQSHQKFGDYSTAGKFYYQEMECQIEQLNFGLSKIIKKIFKWSCGYGEKPENVIVVSLFLIFVSAFLYLFGGIEFVGSNVLKVPPNVIDYNLSLNVFGIRWVMSNIDLIYEDLKLCLYTSVITFTTLGYGDVHPIGFSRFVASVEAGFGIIMTALFIFVFTRKMLR